MKLLASDISNTLNKYKSTIHIKKRYVLAALIAAAERASTNDGTVKIEIANNSNAQDEANWQNVFRLAEIGVKEGITEGITKIVGRDIINPILQTTDQFQIHQLFTAIT